MPDDWQEEIVPYWSNYAHNSKIFGLEENNKTVAGGIVFSTVSPDTEIYKDIALQYFNNGYLYLGFIYVLEHRRGEGLGLLWLKELHALYPLQKWWLAIDNIGLSKFYGKLGYSIKQELDLNFQTEWLMAHDK
ncbi:MAG: GNAT family N-acetyltransferase [Bacteroidales bacterium]|nr:GNAT family N-acetyltransferase [Bacteroidales bacterium]